MATVREKSSMLSTEVEKLERSLNTANQDYDTTKQQLRSTKSEVSDWERIKRNASYDMTYYRRKLEQEVEKLLFTGQTKLRADMQIISLGWAIAA